jgi:hypothetical protein
MIPRICAEIRQYLFGAFSGLSQQLLNFVQQYLARQNALSSAATSLGGTTLPGFAALRTAIVHPDRRAPAAR